MIRYNLYITKDQLDYLNDLSVNGLSVSEHIRLAIDKYIKEDMKSVAITASPSKKGVTNGK